MKKVDVSVKPCGNRVCPVFHWMANKGHKLPKGYQTVVRVYDRDNPEQGFTQGPSDEVTRILDDDMVPPQTLNRHNFEYVTAVSKKNFAKVLKSVGVDPKWKWYTSSDGYDRPISNLTPYSLVDEFDANINPKGAYRDIEFDKRVGDGRIKEAFEAQHKYNKQLGKDGMDNPYFRSNISIVKLAVPNVSKLYEDSQQVIFDDNIVGSLKAIKATERMKSNASRKKKK